jgi:hypothetical protein
MLNLMVSKYAQEFMVLLISSIIWVHYITIIDYSMILPLK